MSDTCIYMATAENFLQQKIYQLNLSDNIGKFMLSNYQFKQMLLKKKKKKRTPWSCKLGKPSIFVDIMMHISLLKFMRRLKVIRSVSATFNLIFPKPNFMMEPLFLCNIYIGHSLGNIVVAWLAWHSD